MYYKKDLPSQVININLGANTTRPLQIDNINSNYISAEYDVSSNVSLSELKVTISNNTYNAIITDTNNNAITNFASNKKFKILIPKQNLNGISSFSVDMNIVATSSEYNAYYGTAYNSGYQDIGVAIMSPVTRNLSANATYNNTTNLDVFVKNKSGQVLPNSQVKITNPYGESIGTYVTDSNGKINLKYIVNGNYTAELISVPSGYSLDSTITRTTNIAVNTTGTINFIARKNTGIIVNSVDKQGNKIQNTLFRIINKSTGEIIKEAKSNENGEVTFDNLTSGTYSVNPVKTIEGYKIDTSPKDIVVYFDSEYSQLSFTNYLLGSIEIIKKNINGNLLDGVKFKITKKNDNTVIGTYTTDINGRIYVPNLYSGDYLIQETEAKSGYYNDNKTNILTVKNEDEI